MAAPRESGAFEWLHCSTLASEGSPHAEACLDRETLTAARIHEFETMMMAVSLRCKAIGSDIVPVYEAMLGTHRPIFAAADRRLRAFFAPQKRAFESYSTQLGNRYGGGATDPANCMRFERVARELADKPGVSSLGRVVFAMIERPRISGVTCPAP